MQDVLAGGVRQQQSLSSASKPGAASPALPPMGAGGDGSGNFRADSMGTMSSAYQGSVKGQKGLDRTLSLGRKVRTTPTRWPRSWADFSLF
jgi:hypothetical protein